MAFAVEEDEATAGVDAMEKFTDAGVGHGLGERVSAGFLAMRREDLGT